MRNAVFAVALLLLAANLASAQDNYEIQVYGSETVPARETMVELHSNFTVQGTTTEMNGLAPTNHALHETVEITHGWNDWSETGFYIFTSAWSGGGWDYVGFHIRPRVRAPDEWHWPVGASLSLEFGYQRPLFSVDTWTLELRPIMDRKIGRWYMSLNPTLEFALVGQNAGQAPGFSPNAKVSYEVTEKVAAGLEYYGAFGPINDFDPFSQQQQQFFPAIDLYVSPKWEINFGVGVGATQGTDHLIVKCILGRRFNKLPFHRKSDK